MSKSHFVQRPKRFLFNDVEYSTNPTVNSREFVRSKFELEMLNSLGGIGPIKEISISKGSFTESKSNNSST